MGNERLRTESLATPMLYDGPDLYDPAFTSLRSSVAHYLSPARQRAGAVLALACGSGQLIIPVGLDGVYQHGPRSVFENAVSREARFAAEPERQ